MTAKQSIWRVLKEPFVHFLFVGFLLFVVYGYVGGKDTADESKRIMVGEDSLIDFLRFRSKSIAPESFESQYENFSADELQRLVEEFVRVEALYREAQAMGLDQNDFGARQRLISQLEFVNQGVVSSAIKLSDDELKDYLETNKHRYHEPATITFTHVFFSAERHGDDRARKMAESKLKELSGDSRGNPVAFHEAPAYGDRFLFHQNYVKREASEIESHFGEQMQRRLFALDPDATNWRGPFQSPYGYHLVLVTAQADRYLPSFEELQHRLQLDAYQARLDEELRQLEESVVEGYAVEFDEALQARLEQGRPQSAEKQER